MVHFASIREGFVTGAGRVEAADLAHMQEAAPGKLYVVVPAAIDPADWSYVDGALVPAKAMALDISKATIAADGADEAVISGLPPGAQVRVGADWTTIDDGTAEVSAVLPGIVTVLVRAPGYRRQVVTIEATA